MITTSKIPRWEVETSKQVVAQVLLRGQVLIPSAACCMLFMFMVGCLKEKLEGHGLA